MLGALVASSFAWSVWSSHTDPLPAFFTSTTRIWELGVGALLAVALAGRPRPRRTVPGAGLLGWAAVAVLLAVAVALPQDVAWPGAWALLPTLPTAVLLWVGWQHTTGGPLRLLGSRPMVWFGALSYSIYLWHWPVIVLGEWSADWAGTTLPSWGRVALALASIGPAWLSWRFVESPIHHGPWLRRRPRALVASGLAISAVGVVAALALVPVRSPFVTTPPGAERLPPSALGANTLRPGEPAPHVDDPGWVTPDPLPRGAGPPRGGRRPLPGRRRRHLTGGVRLRRPTGHDDRRPRGRLQGDAVAARPRGGRGPAGVADRDVGEVVVPLRRHPRDTCRTAYPECDTWNDAVVRELREDPPEVVVTSGVATAAWVDGTADRVALVEGYAARWRVLMTEGTRVIVVGDSPASPDDLDVCAARHPRELSRCAFDAVPAVARSALPLQREAVASSGGGVALLDLTRGSVRSGAARRSSDTSPSTGPVTTSPRRMPRHSPPQLAGAVDDALAG